VDLTPLLLQDETLMNLVVGAVQPVTPTPLTATLQSAVTNPKAVNVGQEFCPPDQLPRAKMRITTLPEVCGVLQTLLADEGFTSQLGSTLPPELK
jgi:hypothetical protein